MTAGSVQFECGSERTRDRTGHRLEVFVKEMQAGSLAAERRKICSPRREPWVSSHDPHQPRSGGTLKPGTMVFRPSGAASFL